MSVNVIEKRLPSSDGEHDLFTRLFIPEGAPKGIFHVVHGMQEYIGRYEKLMTEMAQAGYLCVGFDNLGHGKTARSDDELGFIAEKGGWNYLCEDVFRVAMTMKKEYGEDLPYILMGHSMGSFIVRAAAVIYRDFIDKLIVMGTGGPNPAAGVGLSLIGAIKKRKGDHYVSDFIENMAFGAYNKRFSAESDEKTLWLSKDKSVRDAYSADKYCTFKFTVSAMGDLMNLLKFSNTKEWFVGMRKDLPILLVSGSDDPVGNYGKGVRKVYDNLKKYGADVKMKLYNGYRHEILNDACHDEVVADILDFVK